MFAEMLASCSVVIAVIWSVLSAVTCEATWSHPICRGLRSLIVSVLRALTWADPSAPIIVALRVATSALGRLATTLVEKAPTAVEVKAANAALLIAAIWADVRVEALLPIDAVWAVPSAATAAVPSDPRLVPMAAICALLNPAAALPSVFSSRVVRVATAAVDSPPSATELSALIAVPSSGACTVLMTDAADAFSTARVPVLR